MTKATVSVDDLIKKAALSKSQPPKPLVKNYTKTATSFITRNFSEKKTVGASSKSGAKVEQKWSKSGVKTEQKWSKSGVKVEQDLKKSQAPISKLEHKPEYELEQKWSKSGVKVEQDLEFSTLVGLQKKLLIILFDTCSLNGSLETPKITLDFLANQILNPRISIKKALQILEKKGFLIRKKFKNGRGGWTIFELPKFVYQEILQTDSQAKLRQNWSKTGVKVEHKPEYKPEYPAPSSSIISLSNSKSYITTTTNREISDKKNQEMSDAEKRWALIQTPEILKKIGFGKSHIEQIKNKYDFEPEQISEFLQIFSYDLQKGYLERIEKKGVPVLSYFFGALKRGGYNSVYDGYKTVDELAKEEEDAWLERREAIRQRRIDLQFEEWLEEIPKGQISAWIKKPANCIFMDETHRLIVRDFFVKKILPKYSQKIEQKRLSESKNQEKKHSPLSPTISTPSQTEPSQNTKQKRQKNASDVSFRLDLDSKHLSN